MSNISIEINGDGNEVVFGAGAVVANVKIRMDGANHKLHIGELCRVNGGEFVFSHEKGAIEIGKGTFINSANLYCTESAPIHMGERCMLAWNIEIYSGDFHPIFDSKTNVRSNPAKAIHIGDHVWIGAHVQVLKGVSIGENSVIGTRAVVTRSIPGNCIAVGTPARIMKSNIYWKE